MNDADFIEELAADHDRAEIWYRSQGMFEAAVCAQYFAACKRARHRSCFVYGIGATSLSAVLSDGRLHVTGDMSPEDTRITGQYLLDTADTYELEKHAAFVLEINAATRDLMVQLAQLLPYIKRPQPEGPDGPP